MHVTMADDTLFTAKFADAAELATEKVPANGKVALMTGITGTSTVRGLALRMKWQ
jgi:hypothetical protein